MSARRPWLGINPAPPRTNSDTPQSRQALDRHRRFNSRLKHLRGPALGFRNLTKYITRCLLETGRLHAPTSPWIVKSQITQIRSKTATIVCENRGHQALNLAFTRNCARWDLEPYSSE